MASYPPIKAGTAEELPSDILELFRSMLVHLKEHDEKVVLELKLLNTRFEAMAETYINESDVEK